MSLDEIKKLFLNLGYDERLIGRYISLVSSLKGKLIRNEETVYHKHHILPRSLFPDYKNLEIFSWNCVPVTPREHFILHWVLAKAETSGFKMSTAFFYMTTKMKKDGLKITPRVYHSCILLYSRNRKHYTHSQDIKDRISSATKLAFKNDPSRSRKISMANKGKKLSKAHKDSISRNMKENNPMKKEYQRERMRGDKNVSKRPDVRSLISKKIKDLDIQPWEHPRSTEVSKYVWSLAERAYEFYSNGVRTCSELHKLLGVENKTPLYNLKIKLDNGWNPSNDEKWKKFYSDWNNEASVSKQSQKPQNPQTSLW